MGYACPVCGDPQADADHLANHLAFTAMLGDEAHEEWLDGHAPDWRESDAAALAPIVTDHAAEVEFPQVFEDTANPPGDGHDHHTAGHDADLPDGAREHAARDAELDAEARQTLEDAREMTRQMMDDTVDDDTAAGDDADEAETE